jgi:SAM-dependent methyltransferase
MEHDHGHGAGPHEGRHGPHEGAHGGVGLAELLDLDGDVLRAYLDEATAWVHGLVPDLPRRVLDLGAGTGTGTVALARRFGQAEVTALDVSPDMLGRVRDKARRAGLDGRVRTIQADLNAAVWPAIEPADLAWASASLHEVADPQQTLTGIRAAIRPGGLLVVVEMDGPPRFLPDDIGLGRPGLEARLHARLEGTQPLAHEDWGPRLTQAGFTVAEQRNFAIGLRPPLPAAAGRYAVAYLRRIRPAVEPGLTAADRATLGALLDGDGPDALLHRTDLTVRGTRTAWAARRP